ncbi:MAG: helix-turn-helix domain-containing protein [Candidatus Bathyarchaeia archaeon]
MMLKNIEFIGYNCKPHGCCSNGGVNSKASLILHFIKENADRAYFTTEIVKALAHAGVKPSDIMSNVRRWEKKGLVLVRGYKLDERQTPFAEGYLVTWIDPFKPREEAIKEAVDRTELALKNKENTNPTIQRVHRIRDLILESSRLKELISFTFIQEHLGCSKYEAEVAVNRALQLYSDLKEIKLFNAFRYFYHNLMTEEELKAAIAMKENYIRMTKGKANRIGHNWEAVAEWFIDRFTTGARFWMQNHRINGMDPRRITIHLIKSVGGRKRNAEVDRVWEVTPGVFAPPITYVLSCKWGLVCKRDVDDFFEVLRWSKEFGVNTPNGREIRQGVIGVFAGSSFNPKENVQLKNDCSISLTTYAAKMNIQLLKAADFNAKLHQRGCSVKVSVQKICKVAKDEREVREILENIWDDPKNSEKILENFANKNKSVYEFEKLLEQK